VLLQTSDKEWLAFFLYPDILGKRWMLFCTLALFLPFFLVCSSPCLQFNQPAPRISIKYSSEISMNCEIDEKHGKKIMFTQAVTSECFEFKDGII
jgi:hypothetical protein